MIFFQKKRSILFIEHAIKVLTKQYQNIKKFD